MYDRWKPVAEQSVEFVMEVLDRNLKYVCQIVYSNTVWLFSALLTYYLLSVLTLL